MEPVREIRVRRFFSFPCQPHFDSLPAFMKIPSLVRAIPAVLLVGGSLAPLAMAEDFLRVDDGSPPSGLTASPDPITLNLGLFNIVINPDAGLAANLPALAAFNRAAAQWEAYISDPITITIDAHFSALGPGIIGSTSSLILQADYNTIRDQMVADASNEGDDAVVAFLPTAAQFSATLKAGSSLTGNVIGTKANLKAAGFEDLDFYFGASDATITFSSTFAFDFDNSNGVGAGLLDFETVAAHELGHALGFFSSVDSAVAGDTTLDVSMLDLFRFRNNTASDPSTNAQFTSFARDLVPGNADIFDDLTNEYLMSTGLTGGDGRQASHWKDDALIGANIGIMDPTLATGVFFKVAPSDLRALDLIGYEITLVPELTSLLLGGLGAACFLGRRRRI